MRPLLTHGAAAIVAAATALVLMAAPAAADPPRPTDYRSTITGITPSTPVVEPSIVGGDAFLELRVEPGHEAIVTGYDNEPYLRFAADGTVSENRNSPATYTNARRYGEADVPDGVDPKAAPEWRQVADDGTYAWHDHRIHWMSPQAPGVARGEEIQSWNVALVVDDQAVTIDGVLRYEPGVGRWPWVAGAVAVAVAGAVWWAGRRWTHTTAARLAGGVGCLIAVVVAGAEQLSIPEEAGRSVLRFGVPAVGLACAIVAVLLRRTAVAVPAGLASIAAVAGWAVRRLDVFTKPVLPTVLAPNLDRTGTALALGLAAGAVALALTDDSARSAARASPDAVDAVDIDPVDVDVD